jgi:hypothetical protein
MAKFEYRSLAAWHAVRGLLGNKHIYFVGDIHGEIAEVPAKSGLSDYEHPWPTEDEKLISGMVLERLTSLEQTGGR